jgi:hypothetical protein
MATLNPQTEALALAQRLRDDAQDPVEARTALFFALMTLQEELRVATAAGEEHKAGLVLEQRAVKAGKTSDQLKAEIAAMLEKVPSRVTAVEVVEAIPLAPTVVDGVPIAPAPKVP